MQTHSIFAGRCVNAVLVTVVLCGSASILSAQDKPIRLTGKPYIDMDYGPFFSASIELAPGNIAYKGIAVRLDEGPGGVSQGRAFMIFDTDTLRMAGGWTGEGFIDWHGIVLDGAHGVHPRISGSLVFSTPVGPGWAEPQSESWEDPRLRGLDGKPYGPLPRHWAHWKGLYTFGHRVIFSYRVGTTSVLEWPSMHAQPGGMVLVRHLELGPQERTLKLRLAAEQAARHAVLDADTLEQRPSAGVAGTVAVLQAPAAQGDGALDWSRDFTITAWIKTAHPTGTIASKAAPAGPWVRHGKTFFVRRGRLGFDIGWVGVVTGKTPVADGTWHHVGLTHRASDGQISLYVDGKLDGQGHLKAPDVPGHVMRLGYTATNFVPPWQGFLDEVRFYQRVLAEEEIRLDARSQPLDGILAWWPLDGDGGNDVPNAAGGGYDGRLSQGTWGSGRWDGALVLDGKGQVLIGGASRSGEQQTETPWWTSGQVPLLAIGAAGDVNDATWELHDGVADLVLPPAPQGRRLAVCLWRGPATALKQLANGLRTEPPLPSLRAMTTGGPLMWNQRLATEVQLDQEPAGPFAVDVIPLPQDNPWRSWIRPGGFDFFSNPRRAALCSWQGDVWILDGLGSQMNLVTWRRFATGLFQPLGLKIVGDQIYVLGRDQITRLHDINGDGQADFYENFNNDAQVTEHFHEFAMDLQTDAEGNFYYTKGGRHALPAVVPHHGTLIRVSRDGRDSRIIARGFRAPNGLCVNPDGTFIISDQEGHWTPMNRINWVRPGGFYGYMMAYVPDKKDTSYDPPLCWVHKETDRSPAEQLWVTSRRWGPLYGSLISLSYGTGRIFLVPHEQVGQFVQGGIVRLPIPELPTGIHRGRFHPEDQQLYVCGLFGWSSNKTQPGGLFRIRYTGKPVDVPLKIHAVRSGIVLQFPFPLDPAAATNPRRFRVQRWNYKRTAQYGSDDYRISDGAPGRDTVAVRAVALSEDQRSILIQVADMVPCMQMRIHYNIKTADGREINQYVENSIHEVGPDDLLQRYAIQPRSVTGQAGKDVQLAEGLLISFRSPGRATEVIDTVPTRMAALRLDRDTPVTPWAGPGPVVAQWDGMLDVPAAGRYAFALELTGTAVLEVDGRRVLRAQARTGVQVVQGQPVELPAGPVPLSLQWDAPPGEARIRLLWQGPGFAWEPVPPWVLKHDPALGLARHHASRNQGRQHVLEKRCLACHRIQGTDWQQLPALYRPEGPSLEDLPGRLNPDWVYRWILAPQAIRPDATMPRLLDPQRQQDRLLAADLVSWLFAGDTARQSPAVATFTPDLAQQGLHLWEDLGCIACHRLDRSEEDEQPGRIPLHYVAEKYRPGALIQFLLDPQHHYQATRMPNLRLSRAEATALAAFLWSRLSGGEDGHAVDLSLPPGNPQRGKEAFEQLGCIACHRSSLGPAQPGRRAIPLSPSTSGACLATGDQEPQRPGIPRYRWTPGELRAVMVFLQDPGERWFAVAPWYEAEQLVEQRRCLACHGRDGEHSRLSRFLIEEGERGVVPQQLPDLTWTGEKLQGPWLQQWLADPGSHPLRPWLTVRMPAHADVAGVLARGLTASHGVPHDEPSPPPSEGLVEVGRQLTLPQALNCVQCHGVGDQPAVAPFDNRGVNLEIVGRRLRRRYYDLWMRDPLRLEPRSKMPQFVRDGRTTAAQFFGGDAQAQIEAIWAYLLSVQR